MIYYLRDSNSKLVGLKYNNNLYYYLKNAQDDIIGLLDSNYNLVAEYLYDSWGNVISIKDNLGNEITDTSNIAYINPFRYRSYYYDSETKLYYLNSRYYNPAWGRFINADILLFQNNSLLGNSLFTYVNNNPIRFVDNSGYGIVSSIMGLFDKFRSLNKKEKQVSITDIFGAFTGNKAAEKATKMREEIYNEPEEDGTESNAYKHAMWNAIMTYEMGYDRAKKFADAHEWGTQGPLTDMDIHNNEMGRQIAKIFTMNYEKYKSSNILNPNPFFNIKIDQSYAFEFLGDTYVISAKTDPYEMMSDMILSAIDNGVAIVLK